MNDVITGKVIKVLDDNYRVVINQGSDHGVRKGQYYLVYKLGEELFDPETKESLGHLEIVCGEGSVEHIQPKMTTLRTSKTVKRQSKKVIKRPDTGVNNYTAILRGINNNDIEEIYEPEEITAVPFYNVDEDCLARRIK